MNKRLVTLQKQIPVGTVFSELTVVGYAKNNYGVLSLRCRCKCGSETVQRRDNLKKGRVVSCGCFIREKIKKHGIHKRLPPGQSQLNSLFYRHGWNCRRKGIATALTREQFEALVKGRCHYCGAEPAGVFTQSYVNGTFLHGGIDRVDSAVGYVLENCVPCCKHCNTAKNDMSSDQFKQWLRRAAGYFLGMA